MFKQKHEVLRYRSTYAGLASRRLANTIRAAVTLDPKTFPYVRDHHLAVQTYLAMTIIPDNGQDENEPKVEVYINHKKHWTICSDGNFDLIAIRAHHDEDKCIEFSSVSEFLGNFNGLFREVANKHKAAHEADIEISKMLSPQFNERYASVARA